MNEFENAATEVTFQCSVEPLDTVTFQRDRDGDLCLQIEHGLQVPAIILSPQDAVALRDFLLRRYPRALPEAYDPIALGC